MYNKLRQTLPTTVIAAVLGCLLSVPTATADQVIPDDLIVQVREGSSSHSYCNART